jgi:hypothetical protein
MDAEERREAMRERISQEEQRAALWGDDEKLAAAGTAFRLLYRRDVAERPDWTGGLVPSGMFHLDWSQIEHAHHTVFEEERADYARDALAARLGVDDLLWVVPGNGLAPIIEISRAGFDAHAEMLTEQGSEMWLSGAPNWLIEFRKWDARIVG